MEHSSAARIPTMWGPFTAHCYRSVLDGIEHIAMVKVINFRNSMITCGSCYSIYASLEECDEDIYWHHFVSFWFLLNKVVFTFLAIETT